MRGEALHRTKKLKQRKRYAGCEKWWDWTSDDADAKGRYREAPQGNRYRWGRRNPLREYGPRYKARLLKEQGYRRDFSTGTRWGKVVAHVKVRGVWGEKTNT